MSSSASEISAATAHAVAVLDDELKVELNDGRTLLVPLVWYPRLLHGTSEERSHWRMVGAGRGIHWPDLDEDISVEGLLLGRRSGESQTSLKRWLEGRRTVKNGSDACDSSEPRKDHGGRHKRSLDFIEDDPGGSANPPPEV
jgi:hypothetical protein